MVNVRSRVAVPVLLLAALLARPAGARPAAAQAVPAAQSAPAAASRPGNRPWLAGDEVFYQILVRSFRDSNGDRIGDLKGIEQGLDYLQKLGVTSLLLTPICPSPFYHNYFCTDFEGVDPAYGTRRDFEDLARAVHARRMKLYLDMEGQYVAEGHPWWTQSQGNPASEYSHYLIYHGPGNTKVATAVFEITGAPAYDGRTVGLTTVNLRDPAVLQYFRRIFLSFIDPNGDRRFDDGVDGFRLDHMMDDLDGKPELKNLFADFWAPIFAAARALNPRIRFVAEQADWLWGDDWLTRGGADMVFAFPLQRAIASLNRDTIAAVITRMARQTPAGKGELVFIENHDVMRFASKVQGDARKERVGAALGLLLEGTPLIYYGQEIGMKGKQSSAWGWGWNDIPVREAFRWTRSEEAPGSAIWYAAPLDSAKGPSPWWAGRFNRPGDGVSVQEETKDPASLLSWYRRLLALRRERPELRQGDERVLETDCRDVLAVVRSSASNASLLLVNLGDRPQVVTVSDSLPPALRGRLTDLLTRRREPRGSGALHAELAPFAVKLLAPGP